MRLELLDKLADDNLAEIHAVPKLRGHKLAKIDAFVGELLLGSVRALDDDGLSALYHSPHQLAEVDASFGRAHHTAHAHLRLINQLID